MPHRRSFSEPTPAPSLDAQLSSEYQKEVERTTVQIVTVKAMQPQSKGWRHVRRASDPNTTSLPALKTLPAMDPVARQNYLDRSLTKVGDRLIKATQKAAGRMDVLRSLGQDDETHNDPIFGTPRTPRAPLQVARLNAIVDSARASDVSRPSFANSCSGARRQRLAAAAAVLESGVAPKRMPSPSAQGVLVPVPPAQGAPTPSRGAWAAMRRLYE